MSTNDTPSADRIYRILGTTTLVAIVMIGVLLGVLATGADGSVVAAAELDDVDTNARRTSGVAPSRLVLSHLKLRDTVYTTDSVYLEVNLTKQNVTVHRRGGEARTFLVSSGNPYISEGMATPMG